jgi:23S rRNA pseudouridine1911/1915/1917 synthase
MDQIYTADSNVEGVVLENPTSELMTYGMPFKSKDIYLFQQVNGKKRLDVLLAERHPETSRSTWQKHIKAGHISVNNTPAKSPKQEVTEADSIAIKIPDSTDFSTHELPIIYLDDDVIVVNKPAGVLTHSKGALNDEFTVADFFRRYTTVGLDTNRPGIVHRLDRDTSGVIIGARTPEAFDLLKSQFADRKTNKFYVAIVDGTPKQIEAKIDIPIGRNPSSPSTFRADSKGKSAITDYKVLSIRGNKSLLSLHPLTGRTHQLRVHLAHLGTPITGDRVYGKSSERLYLHAYKLEVTTALAKRQTFTAPVPESFEAYFPEVNNEITRV